MRREHGLAETPSYAHRWYLRAAAVFFAVIVAIMSAQAFDLPKWIGLGTGTLTVRTVIPIMVFIFVFFLLWLWIVVRWEHRLLRSLRTYDYRLCARCAYPLAGRTGAVRCPECGAPCNIEELRKTWMSFRPRLSGVFRRGE